MLTSMFELVIHDVPLEITRECARDIHAFEKIMLKRKEEPATIGCRHLKMKKS